MAETGDHASTAKESLSTLLHRAAAVHHRETATALEDLRDRLGRDGTSMEEWNGLVSSASHHRLESWRRDCASGMSHDEASRLMLEKVR
jgi:hypothetical protein